MRLELEPRRHRPPALDFLAPALAFAAALLIGALMMLALGKSPTQAFDVYFVEPLSQQWSREAILKKAAPLVLIAIGLSFCYRANVWNIGAEGQFVVGGAIGGYVGLLAQGQPDSAAFWVLPAMMLTGALAGALYALIPATLKVRFGVSEILTSLMLVYVAELWLDYMVRGPWRARGAFNMPVSDTLDPAATLPALTREGLHAGVLLAPLAALAAILALKTLFGFRARLVGDAPKAARFAGFSDARVTLSVFALSGALAGLAGVAEVSGSIGQLQTTISPGYGFTAIIVAFLGRLSPIGVLFAGFVMALTFVGGEGAQIAMKLPLDATRAFQGVLLMCVLAADVVTRYRVRLVIGEPA
jgi:simple sugar transport system permease protein